MQITEVLLLDGVRTMLKIALVFAVALLFWLRLYRAAIAEAQSEAAELKSLKAARSRSRMRVVTEEDFDAAAEDINDDKRLEIQRRAEALGWSDDYDGHVSGTDRQTA